MKIKTKLLLIAIIPIVVLSIVLSTVSNLLMQKNIVNQAYTGMESTAISISQLFSYASNGQYLLKDDGLLYKGTLNLSASLNIVDRIKDETGLDVTIFYGDTRYLTSIVDENNERQVGTKAGEKVIEAVLEKGETYANDNVDILGTRYIAYYVPLYQEGTDNEIIGMVFLGNPYSNVASEINSSIINLSIVTLVFLIIIGFVSVLFGNRISKPLLRAVTDLSRLADRKLNGELDAKLLKRQDEIGQMYRAVQEVDGHLAATITGIQKQSIDLMTGAEDSMDNTSNVGDAIEQISATVQEVTASVVEQTSDVNDARTSIDEMGQMIQNTADEMDKIHEQAIQMQEASNGVMGEMNQLKTNMASVLQSVEEISVQTQDTKVATDQISEAAIMVSSIADETNLLALNASIEAARAGEAGRGFAVVADQIQQLAEQSNKSANQIQEMLKSLQHASTQSVSKMEEVTEKVKEQEQGVDNATTMVDQLNTGINVTADSVSIASGTIKPLLERKNAVIEKMKFMEDATQNIAASMQQTSASVQVVAEMSGRLKEQANDIKIVAETLEEDMSVFEIEER